MTINRDPDGETMRFECDECGDMLDQDFPQAHFQAMLDHAKGLGWTAYKQDHAYRHWCPDCKPSNLGVQKKLFGLR